MNDALILNVGSIILIAINLLFAFMYFIVFAFGLFTLNRRSFFHFEEKKIWIKIIFYLLIGAVMGTIFPSMFFLMLIRNSVIFPLLCFSAIWMCSIVFSKYICVGGVVPLLLSIFFFVDADTSMVWFFIAMYAIMILIIFISSYLKTYSHINFFIWQFLFLIIGVSISCWFFLNSIGNLLLNLGISFVINTIFFYSLFYMNKIFDKLRWLSSTTLYDDKYYIHPNFIMPVFEQEIIDKNIDHAYLIIFNFYGLENVLLSKGRRTFNRIKKSILNTIHTYFQNEDCIFIKTAKNNYGIILKASENFANLEKMYLGNKLPSRVNDDELKKIENIMNLLPKKITYDTTQTPVNIVGFLSIYGIHSCLLNELINNCEQTLLDYNHASTGSKIQLCDFNDSSMQSTNEKIAFAQLNKLINTKDIKTSLAPKKIDDLKILVPNFFSLRYLTSDLQKILNRLPNDMSSILVRHLAIRTLILYNQYPLNHNFKLCLYYPISELMNENFSAKKLAFKIKSYNINFSKIIFVFDLNYSFLTIANVTQNINEMKNAKFQIMYSNVKTEDLDFIKKTIPHYISFSINVDENKDLKQYFTDFCLKLKIKIVD